VPKKKPPNPHLWIPELVDVIAPNGTLYLWVHFLWSYDVQEDGDEFSRTLSLERCGTRIEGLIPREIPPEKYEDEIPEGSLRMMFDRYRGVKKRPPIGPLHEHDLETFWDTVKYGVAVYENEPTIEYTMPEWYDHEMENSGWEGILGSEHREPNWAIEEGIAPEQPFLLRIATPEYYRCSYEYDEWDVNWDWEIFYVTQLDPQEAANRWEAWLVGEEGPRELSPYEQEQDELEELRLTDLAKLYVRAETYDYGGYHDRQMGYRVELCSKHECIIGNEATARPQIIEKRVQSESLPIAFDELLEQVEKEQPSLYGKTQELCANFLALKESEARKKSRKKKPQDEDES